MLSKLLKFTAFNTLLLIGYLGTSYAQPIEIIADYPLILDLSDSTGNNPDVILEGNPTAPTVPSNGVELCQNGIYIVNSNGQNIQTPNPIGFDINNFEIELDFKVTATPNNSFNYSGIIIGGKFSRFIGILVDNQNRIGLKYNNDVGNVFFTSSVLTLNTFYNGRIRYNHGVTELFLDNVSILNQNLPVLVNFQNGNEFTTTDFNTGQPFTGCIKNLKISTTAENVFKDDFE